MAAAIDLDVTADASIDLYWLPLGAGGRFVRFNGRAYERVIARRERRRPQDLYHTALEVRVGDERHTIEMSWPVPADDGRRRGVVAEGSVGLRQPRWLRTGRILRYEVRCWPDGQIPDACWAVEGPERLSHDDQLARRILELTAEVPTAVWGRDELALGEMWNSNSVISWLLERAGLATGGIHPPHGGRAPGWRAGTALALLETPEDRDPVRP